LSRTELIGANLCVCLLDLEQKRDVMTVRCSSKLKKNKNKKEVQFVFAFIVLAE